MDTPGSELSLDSPETPQKPITPPDSSTAQNVSNLGTQVSPAARHQATLIEILVDDSESDVSMSADSDDDDDDGPSPAATDAKQAVPLAGGHSPAEVSKKRKWPDSAGDIIQGHMSSEDFSDLRKRVKADDRQRTPEGHSRREIPLLPAELWQHIFTFCHPTSLGRLLQVNKSFNAYLDHSSSDISTVPLSRSAVRLLKPDAIWQVSRRLFLPGMPTPTSGKTELEVWRLACSSSCEFCSKKQPKVVPSKDQWHPGPGENGIVPIWSFGIRTCGSCLQQQTSKEIDLLLSSSVPSPLLAALPFVFLTNEQHIIPLSTLQSGQHPSGIQITKHFFKQQVNEIREQFHAAKEMGTAAVEEWLKGLDDQGKERRNDAARWERWEASGGIARMLSLESDGHVETRTNKFVPASASASKHFPQPPPPALNGTTIAARIPEPAQLSMQYPTAQLPQIPPTIPNSLSHLPPRYDSPAQGGFGGIPARPNQLPKQERTKDEVAALKAARRAEIERRCMLLKPPLTAGVLAHMTSFQAAIQIIQPLDDSAWEVLKPRLLSQREEAEQRENDRLAQTRVVQERYQDPQIKSEFRDLVDKEWDDIQAPLRTRIGGYADEIIRDGWNGGAKVTKDDAPMFAAEVLIYVRKRFYAEVAKDEAAVRAAGREPEMDPPNGPYTRKLTLENMKWVFDIKVKPYTEQYRKELFLCSACESNFKYYGFEGVIQHFAAKHTSALSNGSIVVCWKSEWPEYPPFNPEPDAPKASYYPTPLGSNATYPGTQPYGYGGYQQPVSGPPQALNPHGYQESPGPYYGHPQYNEQYMTHNQSGPFAPPPQVYPEVTQGYPPQYSMAQAPNNPTGHSEQPPQDYSQQPFGGPYPAAYPPSSHGTHGPFHPAPVYSTSAQESTVPANVYPPHDVQYGQPYAQPQPAPAASNHNQGPYRTEEYKAQLLEVARNAREVWNAVNNVKEVPGSIKVYTIIHYLLKRSRESGQDDPSLAMIIDGLSSNKDMRPIRNINGLLCKACTIGMPGSTAAMLKKHYSFPQLLNHFNSVHAQASSFGGNPDWTTDMIELPDSSKMSAIKTAPGINDERLHFFTDALPEILAPPSPVEEDPLDGAAQRYLRSGNLDPYGIVPPSQDNHEKYYNSGRSTGISESASTPYDSNQYDPRNPRDIPEPPRESTHLYRDARRFSNDRGRVINSEPEPSYRSSQGTEEREPVYRAQAPGPHTSNRVAPQPSRDLQSDGHRAITRQEGLVYIESRGSYQATGGYQYRSDRPSYGLDEPNATSPQPDYGLAGSQSYHTSRDPLPLIPAQRMPSRGPGFQDASDHVAQQNHIFEVVARISQQAQQAREARERLALQQGLIEAGSEDGEVQAEPGPKPIDATLQPPDEGSNEADRFLNELQPRRSAELMRNTGEVAARREDVNSAVAWRPERVDIPPRSYHPPQEPQRRMRDFYGDDVVFAKNIPTVSPEEIDRNGYIVRERAPQPRAGPSYIYDDRYVNSASEQAILRERSPELVDRRYNLNNVVYRDERQGSHGPHRTPSRYARYESVRLENDRARSRSPVYVKMGPAPGQYHEHSPPAQPIHHQSVYRTRSPPPPAEEVAYERAPRQEYYRVYADEPRARQPQYAEAFEYVQVSDPQGDYMIRRPVRREPEPIYARYEDEIYARQPEYETRAPLSRSDPAYYEEYDPRHPAPPPVAHARPVRYQ